MTNHNNNSQLNKYKKKQQLRLGREMAFGDIILKRLKTLISQAEEMANQPVWLLVSWERGKPHFSKSSCTQGCWTDYATVKKEWDGKMGRSAQKHRVDTPWLHSEGFLSCCLKSRESPLASHIFAWSHGKEKALIIFLSPVWDKDHTKCKSSHSVSYVLTQALHIQEKFAPVIQHRETGRTQTSHVVIVYVVHSNLRQVRRVPQPAPLQHQATGRQSRTGAAQAQAHHCRCPVGWEGAKTGAGAVGAIGNTN